ncbi:MAG: hypothetical protein GPJ50_12925 [Candidatus Heimdallarchaeota archaeon]|nr:hypothetical protein [Candidatus Heimdallarchaeota archaeon]
MFGKVETNFVTTGGISLILFANDIDHILISELTSEAITAKNTGKSNENDWCC